MKNFPNPAKTRNCPKEKEKVQDKPLEQTAKLQQELLHAIQEQVEAQKQAEYVRQQEEIAQEQERIAQELREQQKAIEQTLAATGKLSRQKTNTLTTTIQETNLSLEERSLLTKLYLNEEQILAIALRSQKVKNHEQELREKYPKLATEQKLKLLNLGLQALNFKTSESKTNLVKLRQQILTERQNFDLSPTEKEQTLKFFITQLALSDEQQDKLEDMGITLDLSHSNLLFTQGFKATKNYDYFEILAFAFVLNEGNADTLCEQFTEVENSLVPLNAKQLTEKLQTQLEANRREFAEREAITSAEQNKKVKLSELIPSLAEYIDKKFQESGGRTFAPHPESTGTSSTTTSQKPEQPANTGSRYDDLLANLSQEERERQQKKKNREEARRKLDDLEFNRREQNLDTKQQKIKTEEERRQRERELEEQELKARQQAFEARQKELREQEEKRLTSQAEQIETKKKMAEEALAIKQKEAELAEQRKRTEIEKMEKENEQEQERLVMRARLIEEEMQKRLAQIALEDQESRQRIEKECQERKAHHLRKEADLAERNFQEMQSKIAEEKEAQAKLGETTGKAREQKMAAGQVHKTALAAVYEYYLDNEEISSCTNISHTTPGGSALPSVRSLFASHPEMRLNIFNAKVMSSGESGDKCLGNSFYSKEGLEAKIKKLRQEIQARKAEFETIKEKVKSLGEVAKENSIELEKAVEVIRKVKKLVGYAIGYMSLSSEVRKENGILEMLNGIKIAVDGLGEGLKLLKSLPNNSVKLAFFDPQYEKANHPHFGLGAYFRNQAEFAYLIQKEPWQSKEFKDRSLGNVYHEQPKIISLRNHPHEKPLTLTKKLIQATTEKGDLIVDPCAGGFGVLKVCRETGREFIGYDLTYQGLREFKAKKPQIQALNKVCLDCWGFIR
ncbi:7437_t:CDS:10 [Funneliformis geosporum]|uniref:7437_t:CDS:1 n=1 Tax=Funneliformis geosporum TaxID=1117311 RepID=A0A9W4X1S8_9GLOM|nr:7437_t:CDS:10 [Funneliformis geosporum]